MDNNIKSNWIDDYFEIINDKNEEKFEWYTECEIIDNENDQEFPLVAVYEILKNKNKKVKKFLSIQRIQRTLIQEAI